MTSRHTVTLMLQTPGAPTIIGALVYGHGDLALDPN